MFRSQFLAVESSVEPRKSGASCLKDRSGLSAPFARYYGGVRGRDEARAGTMMDGCALGRSDRSRAKAKKSDIAITKDFAFADICGQLFSAGSVTGQRRRRTVPNGEQRAVGAASSVPPPCQRGEKTRPLPRRRNKNERRAATMPRNFSTPQANTPALGAGLLTPPWAGGRSPGPRRPHRQTFGRTGGTKRRIPFHREYFLRRDTNRQFRCLAFAERKQLRVIVAVACIHRPP
jgi:hypothetical protein